MTRSLALPLVLALTIPSAAHAFCGFYVARADATLYNHASQVALVRDGDRTVLTMANDYQGDPREFALVVPVPTVLKKDQIHVANGALMAHLDAYTAPRLVEYFDGNPCRRVLAEAGRAMSAAPPSAAPARKAGHGVTIEARYTVGEYDILILSATQSSGLVTWLTDNDYRIPAGAEDVIGSYLAQGMKFFVAKVNLGERAKLGVTALRPLQIAFESPKFMLPIRLGTVNADGPQELLIYALTRTGRIETTNYRTVKLPADAEIPPFVKDDFAHFYTDMFGQMVAREGMRTVFLEYAWDMGWCDPCAADPFSPAELRELGVFWSPEPDPAAPGMRRPPPRGGSDVYVTRLHARYDREHFPADLQFQSTGNRENFQGRFVLRHPWRGSASECAEARTYLQTLPKRQEQEVQTLAHLTGWDVNALRRKLTLEPPPVETPSSWWEHLWKKEP